jgi:transcriptional regulator GlxA family with amidase domain
MAFSPKVTVSHMAMKIAMLAYPNCLGSELFGFSDSLLIAERMAQAFMGESQPLFDIRMVGASGRSVVVAGGVRVGLHKPHRRPDLLVVPGFEFGRIAQLRPLLKMLRRQTEFVAATFRRGVPVAAVCVGAFVLAEAGVLDGRRATTAWLFKAELANAYPAVRVESDAMFVEDGGVITTGAFSSGFDLAVHLLRVGGREKIAQMISRMTFLDAQRSSQAPFVDATLLDRSNGAFSDAVKHWLRQRLAERYVLDRLANSFNVSTRTLLRRFSSETGESPLCYLRMMRVEAAKQLLLSSNHGVAAIAQQTGYEDVSTFVRMFREHVEHTPAQYRRRFRENAAY